MKHLFLCCKLFNFSIKTHMYLKLTKVVLKTNVKNIETLKVKAFLFIYKILIVQSTLDCN